jgi:molybdopterin-guanine dinucleotide biosynthesis protein A
MGTEKAVLEANGKTLIEHLLLAFAPHFEALHVSVAAAGPSAALAAAVERAEAATGRRVHIVPDRAAGEGPLGGVASVLEETDAGQVFFMAVDVPAFSAPLAAALWEAAAAPGNCGAMPRWSRGLEPAYAAYARCLFPRIAGLLAGGERSLQALASLPGVAVLDLEDPRAAKRIFGARPPDLTEVFRNLNTPDDLEAWRRGGGSPL